MAYFIILLHVIQKKRGKKKIKRHSQSCGKWKSFRYCVTGDNCFFFHFCTQEFTLLRGNEKFSFDDN